MPWPRPSLVVGTGARSARSLTDWYFDCTYGAIKVPEIANTPCGQPIGRGQIYLFLILLSKVGVVRFIHTYIFIDIII